MGISTSSSVGQSSTVELSMVVTQKMLFQYVAKVLSRSYSVAFQLRHGSAIQHQLPSRLLLLLLPGPCIPRSSVSSQRLAGEQRTNHAAQSLAMTVDQS